MPFPGHHITPSGGGVIVLVIDPKKRVTHTVFPLTVGPTMTQPDPIVGGLQDWINIEPDPDVRCVLVGFDRDFNYMKIVKAARYLQRPDCIFLATNQDPTYPPLFPQKPREQLLVSVPGTGTMVKAVDYSTNRKPILVGKPSALMFEKLKKVHNLNPSRCVMIGDTLRSDIGLAKVCGMKSVLVLTGVTTEAQLQKPVESSQCDWQEFDSSTDPPLLPDFYTNCAGDLITLLN